MKFMVSTRSGKGIVDVPDGNDPRHWLVTHLGKREVLAYELIREIEVNNEK